MLTEKNANWSINGGSNQDDCLASECLLREFPSLGEENIHLFDNKSASVYLSSSQLVISSQFAMKTPLLVDYLSLDKLHIKTGNRL
jgi:hypothetical protein